VRAIARAVLTAARSPASAGRTGPPCSPGRRGWPCSAGPGPWPRRRPGLMASGHAVEELEPELHRVALALPGDDVRGLGRPCGVMVIPWSSRSTSPLVPRSIVWVSVSFDRVLISTTPDGGTPRTFQMLHGDHLGPRGWCPRQPSRRIPCRAPGKASRPECRSNAGRALRDRPRPAGQRHGRGDRDFEGIKLLPIRPRVATAPVIERPKATL
jgi:hypothetical protein